MASAVLAAVVCCALLVRPSHGQEVVANVRVDFRQAANDDSGTCGVPGHACALGHPGTSLATDVGSILFSPGADGAL